MKKILMFLVFGIAAFVTYSYTQKKEDTSFKKEALENVMLASDGSQITFKEILKKYKGKTIVMDVWASWCSDCIKGMPKVKALQAENPDVAYLFISMDKTPEAWKKSIERFEIQGEHYMATDGMKGIFGKSINLDWIPRYMVIDKKGKIALYRAIEADDTKLIETIKTLK
ncbi:TlpA family protein disulfide reductase [Flavobacterium sp. SM15]|uniref:TlpA family protein disulfide reductase n=1 Tax=Flavobacterium sp. SM15 TaxID=2908005 RepID=UPI001EDB8CFC|nr:TlpA disulfide reductase family protein [Flavobacterium sp. SM15]MCG2611972.1 TlpA family protein disulfide reductase [Flavobacterium sp. SM15]